MDLSVRVEAWATDLRRRPGLCREAGVERPAAAFVTARVDALEAA